MRVKHEIEHEIEHEILCKWVFFGETKLCALGPAAWESGPVCHSGQTPRNEAFKPILCKFWKIISTILFQCLIDPLRRYINGCSLCGPQGTKILLKVARKARFCSKRSHLKKTQRKRKNKQKCNWIHLDIYYLKS